MYDIFHMTFDDSPGKRHVEALAEVPIGDGAEDLGQRLIIKGIDGDDVQVTGEAPWHCKQFIKHSGAFNKKYEVMTLAVPVMSFFPPPGGPMADINSTSIMFSLEVSFLSYQ